MAWKRRKVTYWGHGPLGWGASIMIRHCSPNWWFKAPVGLARSFSQCIWQFHQSVSCVVIWRGRLCMPSFTAWLYGSCVSFLMATWFVYSMESSLSWKLVLYIIYASITEQEGILCVSLITQYYEKLWFWWCNRRDFMMANLYRIRCW